MRPPIITALHGAAVGQHFARLWSFFGECSRADREELSPLARRAEIDIHEPRAWIKSKPGETDRRCRRVVVSHGDVERRTIHVLLPRCAADGAVVFGTAIGRTDDQRRDLARCPCRFGEPAQTEAQNIGMSSCHCTASIRAELNEPCPDRGIVHLAEVPGHQLVRYPKTGRERVHACATSILSFAARSPDARIRSTPDRS